MSYVVEIFEPPEGEAAPADLAAVRATLKRMHAMAPATHGKFDELVDALTRRFPDITSKEAESLAEWELAWTDGPLSGGTDSAVYMLGLRRLGDVHRFVIETANAFGLAVFDTQAGGAWYPGRLSYGNAAGFVDAPSDRGEYPDIPDVAQAVSRRIAPLLAVHGFKPLAKGRKFKRRIPGGSQVVTIGMDVDFDPCYFGVFADVRLDAVADLAIRLVYPHFIGAKGEDAFHAGAVMLRPEEWMQGKAGFVEPRTYPCRVDGWEEMDAVIAHAARQVESALLPILDGSRTVEDLDRLMNSDPLDASPFFHKYGDFTGAKNLIVAHLARNAGIAELYERILAKVTARNHRESLKVCMDHALGANAPRAE